MVDLQFSNLGFAVQCIPLTTAGFAWCDMHLPQACRGPCYIEPRYVEDIVLGARDAGMVCNG